MCPYSLSEGGIPLTRYSIPGCDGIRAWTGSGVSVSLSSLLSSLSSSSSSSKSSKICKNAKTEIGDEPYLDKRLGINSDGKLHGFMLCIFFKRHKHATFCKRNTFSRNTLPVLGQQYKIGVNEPSTKYAIVEDLNLEKVF